MEQFSGIFDDSGWTQAGLLLAMRYFYAFTLIVVRMSGLMIIGPIFGQPVVPTNIRVLLILLSSFLIAPTLDLHSAGAMPATLLDYVWVVAGEMAVGFALGLAVFTILSGLQLAGQLVDQQSGVALGEVFSPGLDVESSVSGQFLYLLGVTVFLALEPTGGHLRMISALVETFHTLPLGQAWISLPVVDLLRDLVHQSLVLAIQVAAPLFAAMSLVAVTMGFLGHTVPQVNVLVVGFPVRVLVSLLILSVTLSGAARVVVDAVPGVIDGIAGALAGTG